MGVSAQSLSVRLDGDYLHDRRPAAAFSDRKTAEPLERRRVRGIPGTVHALDGRKHAPCRPASVARFAMSYDIWEETFLGNRVQAGRADSRIHLSQPAAEAWCLDNLEARLSRDAADKPFWLRVEMRAEDPHEDTRRSSGSPGSISPGWSRSLAARRSPPNSVGPWTPGRSARGCKGEDVRQVLMNRCAIRLIVMFLAATFVPLARHAVDDSTLLLQTCSYSSTARSGLHLAVAREQPAASTTAGPRNA